MSLVLTGAIAAALAVTCCVLLPFGSNHVALPSMSHPERLALRDAGWPRSAFEWEVVRALALLSGLALAGSFGLLPAGFIGALVPSAIVRTIAGRRREERARHTLELLQMTLAALRSGGSLPEALRLAVRESASGPFAAAVRAFDLGAPLDAALRGARAHARDRRAILGLDALSLCVAEQLPASRSVTLIASAVDRLVFEQRLQEDVRARTSGLRMQIVLLSALVPGLAVYLAVTVPGLAATFTTPLGKFVLLPLATILEVAGVIASRRVAEHIT